MESYPQLRLENQICFPLYACAKEVVRRYTPFLEPYNLTYTHYITMMVIWERGEVTVSELGQALHLDSGTLTPVLKRLQANGYVRRTRKADDERCVVVTPTDEGMRLQERLKDVPMKVGSCIKLNRDEALALHGILNKLLGALE